jgi:putative transposase
MVQVLCDSVMPVTGRKQSTMTTSKRRRQAPDQTIRKLADGHKLLAVGKDFTNVCRHLEIAETSWHRWLAH